MIESGLAPLDEIVQGLRLGDNVVWQVNSLGDYAYFSVPFARQAIREGRRCAYVRFAPHEPVLDPLLGLDILTIDPRPGFDSFSSSIHRIIAARGRKAFYVFDNLSALAVEWATDELLANFFQVTCPFLFELDTVAYFALTRGQHAHGTVARVRETTQLLINVYNVEGKRYVHPQKVWGRYSPQMFLPHVVAGETWQPVFSSGDAAQVTTTARSKPLGIETSAQAPWDTVYQKLTQYRDLGEIDEDDPEVAALKEEFSRMMLGSPPELNRLIDSYLTLDDLFNIRHRLIGSGRIGGKATGMLLARRILQDSGDAGYCEILEDHDSFFVGSDVFFTFLVNNNLFRLRLQLANDLQLSQEKFDLVEQRFLAGEFPAEVMEQFRNMLDYFGQAPIIVRSSSLLEDSFGNAFAGKYRSVFCANQGHPGERLETFLRAVKLVYASALNPDVLSYRRRRGLIESDEQMAILVQRVSGRPYKGFFFPALAGVALSRNLYVWTNRIDPEQGVIRLVFGLGTRAVDRVGFDYPRMIPVGSPRLRPETGMKAAKYSQRQVDLIDLEENRYTTHPFSRVVAEPDYPDLYLFVSEVKDGGLYDPISRHIQVPADDLVVTFNNLIDRTPFVRTVGGMVAELEKAYGHPVESEFTASVADEGRVRVNLLQCRPMWVAGVSSPADFPKNVPADLVLFRSNRFIGGGEVENIRYLIYVDPARYAAIESEEIKKSLGRVIGRINAHLRDAEGKELVLGPGRFGSSNINLGVNVSYADIDNASVLVEMARAETGHAPEVSYGTHFFLDLVEAQIIYLAISPDDEGTEFNRDLLEQSPDCLDDFIPDAERFENLVRVIDVRSVTGGKYARVVADPRIQQAICLLDE